MFDTLPDTLLVGCDEENLSRVRVYARAVAAHNSVVLDSDSHAPVYTYDEYGRAHSLTLKPQKYTADSLPRIVELGNMVDDTGMMTIYVTRVGIEPVLTIEAPADDLEEALLPNIRELVIPRPEETKGGFGVPCCVCVSYSGESGYSSVRGKPLPVGGWQWAYSFP